MWVLFLILGLALLLALVLFILFVNYMLNYWKFLKVQHEEPRRLFEVLLAQLVRGSLVADNEEDAQEHYRLLYEQFKGTSAPFCGFYHILQPRVLVLDRELVRQILSRDFSNFDDRGFYHNERRDPLSADLYSVCGRGWKEMRIKLEPTFAMEQGRLLYASMREECHSLLHWVEEALLQTEQQEQCVEVKHLMRRYVVASIANCVFGLDASQQQRYDLKQFDNMAQLALTTSRHGPFINSLLSHYPKIGRRLGFSITAKPVERYFLDLVATVVGEREQASRAAGATQVRRDYLQMLIEIKTEELSTHESAKHDGDKSLKEHLIHELAAHAMGFLKAGVEPTANTLAYVLYELAVNEDVQERVRQEVRDAHARNGNELSYECVQQLHYMQQVILETIRLHPVKPFLIRRTLKDYRVPSNPSYRISKNIYIVIPTFAMHNDPANFPQPDLFQPERFSEEAQRSRDSYSWLGFGEGPRSCIGIHFAQLQMRVVLAHLLTQYRFAAEPKQPNIKCQEGVALHVERLCGPVEGREANIVI